MSAVAHDLHVFSCEARSSHHFSQGDGCILFELMAFGTKVLDADHRSNCLYFMAVIFALSSAEPPTEAQRELNISTQELIQYFRVDGVQHSVNDIMIMFVELLETLTCTRQGLIAHCIVFVIACVNALSHRGNCQQKGQTSGASAGVGDALLGKSFEKSKK
jgi:hypothetical protein